MKWTATAVAIALAGALPLAAQTRDYSRDALFEIFVQPASPRVEGLSFRQGSIEYRTRSTTFRFLPLMLPLPGTQARHTPMGPVDPFELTGISFPDTKQTIGRLDDREPLEDLSLREQWQRWRTRREVEAILRAMP